MIPMRQSFKMQCVSETAVTKKIEFLVGSSGVLQSLRRQRPMEPFAEAAMCFLGRLSEAVRSDPASHSMPDLTAFAFWCRHAHLRQLKDIGCRGENRLGRGVSLHFAPSNIPMLFAYTMAAGLLSGNCAVVRLPQKGSEQADVLIDVMRRLLREEFPEFAKRIVLCRYEHDSAVTEALSLLCDVRVIWGADASVREIRRAPLPPRAFDLPFASRASAALLDAAAVVRSGNPDELARAFYNDTYLNDQNACSSPQIVCWLGNAEETAKAGRILWSHVSELLKQRAYEVPADVAVKKLDAALAIAAEFEDAAREGSIEAEDNRLVRVFVPCLDERLWDFTAPGGFFIESRVEMPDELEPILTAHCQTVSVFGIDRAELAELFLRLRVSGADRITKLGHALDFSLIWDGFDLIDSMSRRIDVQRF